MVLSYAILLLFSSALALSVTGSGSNASTNATTTLQKTVYAHTSDSRGATSLQQSSSESAHLGSYILGGLGSHAAAQSSSSTIRQSEASSSPIESSSRVAHLGQNGSSQAPYLYTNGTSSVSATAARTGYSSPSITSGITTLVPSVPANGNGFAYASACNNELLIYSNITYWATKAVTVVNSSMTTDFTATVTTICNGSASSVVGDLTPISSGYTYWNAHTHIVTYKGAAPSCSIKPDDCGSLQRYITSASEAYDSAYSKRYTTVTLLAPPTAMITGNDIVGWSTIPLTTNPPATAPILTIDGTSFTEGQNYSYTVSSSGTLSQVLYPDGYNYTYIRGTTPTRTAPYKALCTATAGSQCGQCTIHGDHVELIYFPTTTTVVDGQCDDGARLGSPRITCPWGSMIGSPEENYMSIQGCSYPRYNSTSTRNSGPYTVWSGRTFYENRAYISFSSLYASNSCAGIGKRHSDILLTLTSSDILSARYGQYGYNGLAWPFNFGDLNTPIPLAAYYNVYGCYPGSGCNDVFCGGDTINNQTFEKGYCDIVIPQAFEPLLAVPPQLRGIDPAWNDCALGLEGLYDPPKALQPVTTEAGVSMPSATAEPASTQAPSTATKTDQPSQNTSPTNTAQPPADSSTAELQSTSEIRPETSENGSSPEDTSAVPTAVPQTTQEASPTEPTSTADSDIGTSARPTDPDTPIPAENSATSEDPVTSTQDAAGAIASLLGGASTASNDPATTQNVVNPANSAETTATPAAGDSADSPVTTQNVVDPANPAVSAATQGAGGSEGSNNPATTQNAVDPANSAGSTATQGAGDNGASSVGQSGNEEGENTSGDDQAPATTTNALSVLSAAQASQNNPSPTGSDSSGETAVANAGSQGDEPAETSSNGLPGQTPTEPDSSAAPQTIVTFTAQGQAFTASGAIASSGVAVIGDSTLTAGGPAATIGGVSISMASNGVIADDTPVATVQPAADETPSVQTFTAGGQTFTASSAQGTEGEVIVGDSTLNVGRPAATVNGVSLSLGSSGIVADGTNVAPQPAAVETPLVQTFTAGGQTFTASSAQGTEGAVIVGDSTLNVGRPAATVNGVPLSLGSSGIVVDGTTVAPQIVAATTALVQTTLDNGQTLAVNQVNSGGSTYVVVGSSTLSPGQGAFTTNGVVVDAQSSGVALDGIQTIAYATQAAPVPTVAEATTSLIIGDGSITALQPAGSPGVFVVNGATLSQGGSAVTINNTPISAVSTGLVVAGTTTPVIAVASTMSSLDSEVVLTVGGQTITATEPSGSPGVFAIDGTTILQGGSVVTINNTPVSAVSNGLVLAGTTTVAFAGASAVPLSSSDAIVLTVGSQTFTATEASGSSGAYVIDGTTISQGGNAVTINDTPISAIATGLVVGDSTTLGLGEASATSESESDEAVLTLGGQTITAQEPSGSSGVYVVDGTTLSQGSSGITINNTPVSAGSDGLVVGGSTTVRMGDSTATDSDSGSRTTSGVSAAGSGASSSSTSTTSAAARCFEPIWAAALGVCVLVLILM